MIDIPVAASAPAELRRTAAACAGLATVVIGTFLPWLQSGSVLRNSYAGDGSLRTLVSHGGLRVALDAWPFLALVCAVAAGLLVVGRTRPGAVLAALAAAAAGSAAIAVLDTSSSAGVHPAGSGPAVTIAGASLTLLATAHPIVRRRTP